jgi:hypothetical protein
MSDQLGATYLNSAATRCSNLKRFTCMLQRNAAVEVKIIEQEEKDEFYILKFKTDLETRKAISVWLSGEVDEKKFNKDWDYQKTVWVSPIRADVIQLEEEGTLWTVRIMKDITPNLVTDYMEKILVERKMRIEAYNSAQMYEKSSKVIREIVKKEHMIPANWNITGKNKQRFFLDADEAVEKIDEFIAGKIKLSNPIVVKGIAGSGKSSTIAKVIRRMLDRNEKTLVVAPTNVACQVIAEKLADLEGEKVLLIQSNQARVKLNLLGSSIEKFSEKSWLKRLLTTEKFKAWELATEKTELAETNLVEKEKKKKCIKKAREVMMKNGRVVIATVENALCWTQIKNWTRDVTIIDEASMIIDAAALAVVMDRIETKNVIVGDNEQLEPYKPNGFHGIVKSCLTVIQPAVDEIVLHKQFRSLPAIFDYAKHVYHDFKIYHGNSQKKMILRTAENQGIIRPKTAYLLANTKIETLNHSKMNKDVAFMVVKLVNWLTGKVEAKKITVITPYIAMIEKLKEDIKNEDVVVTTLDSCQGSQSQIIIFAIVNNEIEQSKHTNNKNKLLVITTRATHVMFCVVDEKLLKTETKPCNHVKRMIEHQFTHDQVRVAKAKKLKTKTEKLNKSEYWRRNIDESINGEELLLWLG